MTTDAAWRMERDSDSVVWLTIDKPGTSTNVLSSSVLLELDALLQPLARDPPRAVVLISAKTEWLRGRSGHQGIHEHPEC